ncbi:MAG: DUF2442 domain-containing protein [Pseudomonadota bacterium]
MPHLLEAKHVESHKIWLKFNDDQEGVIDLADIPTKFLAARPLADVETFASFYLDEWPTLAWNCGFDLAPEFLYERLTGQRPAWQQTLEATT